MAKQKDKKYKERDSGTSFLGKLKNETRQGILAVIFFVLAAIFILSSFSKAGFVGNQIYNLFSLLFGIGYFLIPLFFIMLSISFLKDEEKEFTKLKVFGGVLFFVSSLGLIDLLSKNYDWSVGGGDLGWLISTPALKMFGFYAGAIILIALLIISCLVLFETRFTVESLMFWNKFKISKKEKGDDVKNLKISEPEQIKPIQKVEVKEMEEEAPKKPKATPVKNDEEEFKPKTNFVRSGKYVPPPLSLLEDDKGRVVAGDIKANANIIKRTLQNFGIDVEMDEVSVGPSVTRYSLKPAEGVKISRILGLQNDLSLALAAHPLRIEAPIPGKSLVGIEIPNSVKSTVGLVSLIASDEFQNSDKPLLLTLGKGISGKSHYANLAKMPHVLVAGATGSGKSVTIHAIITSLLYRNSPEALKFIMVDPKRVELTLYNKIPHLLTPVITDAKKTILALKWATKEMDRRYNLLESHAVKDIDSYHKNVYEPAIKKAESSKKENIELPEPMPYIVVIIDELADIMSAYPRELEAGIVRLAQMSRAVGIHLILSTQRPSVNVITGLIKANVPARVALQVVSQVDSRTILDTMGAEKLLGAGDMLYIGGEMSKPVRIQSAFVSEKEVKDVVKYLVKNYENELIGGEVDLGEVAKSSGASDVMNLDSSEDLGDDDDLYEQAKEEVLKAGKASTSYIQRRLRVGYARAARLVDLLEQRGVVGPGDGAKAREVIGISANDMTGESEVESKMDPVAKKQLEEMRDEGDYL